MGRARFRMDYKGPFLKEVSPRMAGRRRFLKVVVNHCYGGFGLSAAAIVELYKRGSKVVEAFDPEKYYGTKNWEAEHEKHKSCGSVFFDGKILNDCKDGDRRGDAALVSVVEEMGARADGQCAKLQVVEIPDGIDWTIEEYDGQEWVAEAHRTW